MIELNCEVVKKVAKKYPPPSRDSRKGGGRGGLPNMLTQIAHIIEIGIQKVIKSPQVHIKHGIRH